MTTKTIETATFKLVAGTDEAAFLATVPATNALLARQPGFISRRLSVSETGEWVDCAEWESLAAAKAAADAFVADPAAQPFLAAIDMATASMRYGRLIAALG